MKRHLGSLCVLGVFAVLAAGTSDKSPTASAPLTKQDMQDEIKKLEQKKATAIDVKEFAVLESNIMGAGEHSLTKSNLFMRVKNGTKSAISRFACHAVYQTPGRSVPWGEFDFNYEISGGIEPGEEKSWTLSFNMFSDAAKIEPKSDAILKITVTRLYGPDQKELLAFTQEDQQKLEKLRAESSR